MVSTVWLGLDHNYLGDGPPLIFETMVFRGKGRDRRAVDSILRRYTTKEEALGGHAETLKTVGRW